MTFEPQQASWVAVQLAACVLVADFVTGLVHWWEDAYATTRWPEPLRSQVVEPNLIHHENQVAFLDCSAWGRCWHTLAAAGAVCGVALAAGFFTWHWAVVGVVAGFGNEVHAWTHRKAPWPARMLQDMGVLTTPHQHARHHRAPYDRCYCTVTNMLNPPLDAIAFWRALEAVLSLAGVRVRRMTPARRGV